MNLSEGAAILLLREARWSVYRCFAPISRAGTDSPSFLDLEFAGFLAVREADGRQLHGSSPLAILDRLSEAMAYVYRPVTDAMLREDAWGHELRDAA